MVTTLRYKRNMRGIIYHEDITILSLYASNSVKIYEGKIKIAKYTARILTHPFHQLIGQLDKK